MPNFADYLRRAACVHCPWQQVWGPEEMLGWLRSQGKLRRDAKPDLEVVWQLFQAELDRVDCPDCNALGLSWTPLEDDGDWGDARACERCRQPIPHERLELFPHVTRCAACQDLPAPAHDTEDFCPRCGGVMQMRSSRGSGIARYQLQCSDCGYRLS